MYRLYVLVYRVLIEGDAGGAPRLASA